MRVFYLEMLVFVERGKPENPVRDPRSKTKTNKKLKLDMALDRNRIHATLLGGERSHHCAIPATLVIGVCFTCFQEQSRDRERTLKFWVTSLG